MKPFAYIVPSSVEEACAALVETEGPVKILAGGTDVLVQMKRGKLQPKALVSLKAIPSLNLYRLDGDGNLVVGATTPLVDVETSPIVRREFPAVAEAAGWIGSVQVRSRATIGGNLCNAAPSADMAPILVALKAVATISDGRRERTVPLEEFFVGPGETVIQQGELLTAVTVPRLSPNAFAHYERAYRSGMDIATAGVAVALWFASEGSVVEDARVVLGAVAPTPMRARQTEKTLIGEKLDEPVTIRASAKAAEEAKPISDVRSSADYRRTLVRVATRKALAAAGSWAEKGAKR